MKRKECPTCKRAVPYHGRRDLLRTIVRWRDEIAANAWGPNLDGPRRSSSLEGMLREMRTTIAESEGHCVACSGEPS